MRSLPAKSNKIRNLGVLIIEQNTLIMQRNKTSRRDVRLPLYCDSYWASAGISEVVSESRPDRSLYLCCAWHLSAINQAAVDTSQGQSPGCQYYPWFSTLSAPLVRLSDACLSNCSDILQLTDKEAYLLKFKAAQEYYLSRRRVGQWTRIQRPRIISPSDGCRGGSAAAGRQGLPLSVHYLSRLFTGLHSASHSKETCADPLLTEPDSTIRAIQSQ